MAEFTQTTYPVDPEAGKDPLKAETVEQIEKIIENNSTITEIQRNLSIEMTRLHQDDVIYYGGSVYATSSSDNNITIEFENIGGSSNLYYKLNSSDYIAQITQFTYVVYHNCSLVLDVTSNSLTVVNTNEIDRSKHLTLVTNHAGMIKHQHITVMWYPRLQIGTATPTTVPKFIGQEFIDTTNKKIYRAFGTSTASDWIAIN